MTKAQVLSLIDQMNFSENAANSRINISWKAHRKAEKLSDSSIFPILQEIIYDNPKEKDKKIRSAVYFIFGNA
mgnify:CR=1 FL=1